MTVDLNILQQRAQAGNLPSGSGAEPTRSLWSRLKHSIAGVFQQPLITRGGLNINPLSPSIEGPVLSLRKIDKLTTAGLQRASIRGVQTEAIAGQLQAELDRLLARKEVSSETGAENTGGSGPIANIPELPQDPEVTRALPLQTRVDTTNWEVETEKHRVRLSCLLGAFSALVEMRARAGIKEGNNNTLLMLAEKAANPNQTKSLWDLFIESYDTNQFDMSMSGKMKARLFYWSYYKTDLISNTVQAYLKAFLETLTKDLMATSDQTRLKFFRHLLKEANEFLVEDIRATKQFANATEPGGGDLERFRTRAIEKHYGGSLETLCAKFSKAVVEKDADSFIVPFFVTFQKIPLIGVIFTFLEWAINRYIIRNSMKSSILPPVLKSAVENGIEATQPNNLPFATALTRFLVEQLEELRIKVEKSSSSKPPPPALPGTETLLSPIIKNLMLVLDLEKFKTQPELRQRIQEIEAGKPFSDQFIAGMIEEGIKDACNHLFHFLNESLASSKLTAKLMELSCAPFSEQTKTEAVRRAEFAEEQLKLKRVAEDVFVKIIHHAVTDKVNGPKPEEATNQTKAVFQDGKTMVKRTCDELQRLCDNMVQNIDRSREAPTASNNIQSDIASFLQLMQLFANRKEIQDRINALQPADREAIWRIMTPLYEKAGTIVEKTLALQELQDHYPSHADVATHLNIIRELVVAVRNQFRAQPRHTRSPLIQTLEKSSDEIGKILGPKAPITLQLKAHIKSISNLSESIAKEQQILDAIYTFYPPREENAPAQEGLLEQLLSYERGTQPAGFQPKACLDEIARLLGHFLPSEQSELRNIIRNGANLRAKWPQLSQVLQRIYVEHKEIKERNSAQIDEILKTTGNWTQEKADKYTRIKTQDHQEMQSTMKQIATELMRLRNEAYHIQFALPFRFSNEQASAATALLGGLGGWAFTKLGGGLGAAVATLFGTPAAAPIGSAVGGGVAASFYTGVQHLASLADKDPKAITKTATSFAAGTAASYLLPGFIPDAAANLVPLLTPAAKSAVGIGAGALTGMTFEEAIHSNAQEKVFPQVMTIFNDAYGLTLSPRIYHAATTRTMQAISAGA